MVANRTSIANGALLANGQETLGSLEDNTPTAVKIRAIFDLVLLELQTQDWYFNRTRIELTRLEAAPDFGNWLYQYNLPGDLTNIIALVDEVSDIPKYAFEREGAKILTNRETVFLKYNQLIEDVGLMPPWFVNLMEAKLAYKLAPKLQKDENKLKRIKEDLIDAWDEARSGNGQDAFFADEFGDTNGNTDAAIGMRDND
ncbi:hypothetical protein LCGC14_0866260 [marine sediment metagenome]|uniref:Tail tubular protein A n=1 Tax=marine sediment metagenome TaxID=412755 RepID=A0A0F9PRL4_9ZZZZ